MQFIRNVSFVCSLEQPLLLIFYSVIPSYFFECITACDKDYYPDLAQFFLLLKDIYSFFVFWLSPPSWPPHISI